MLPQRLGLTCRFMNAVSSAPVRPRPQVWHSRVLSACSLKLLIVFCRAVKRCTCCDCFTLSASIFCVAGSNALSVSDACQVMHRTITFSKPLLMTELLPRDMASNLQTRLVCIATCAHAGIATNKPKTQATQTLRAEFRG